MSVKLGGQTLHKLQDQFPSGLSNFATDNYCNGPCKPPRNACLVVLKMGMTYTHCNNKNNKSSQRALLREFRIVLKADYKTVEKTLECIIRGLKWFA